MQLYVVSGFSRTSKDGNATVRPAEAGHYVLSKIALASADTRTLKRALYGENANRSTSPAGGLEHVAER